MIQKLIEFLVHFFNFSYNIIAYFYAEICVIYQIYILQILSRNENSSKNKE